MPKDDEQLDCSIDIDKEDPSKSYISISYEHFLKFMAQVILKAQDLAYEGVEVNHELAAQEIVLELFEQYMGNFNKKLQQRTVTH